MATQRFWAVLTLLTVGTFLPAQEDVYSAVRTLAAGGADRSTELFLRHQPASAYGAEAIALLGNLLADPQAGVEERDLVTAVQLIGFVGTEAQLDGLPPRDSLTDRVRRMSDLARVRLGNPVKLAVLLEALETVEVNDDFTYDILPYLVYTRQRPVLDWLWVQLMSRNESCSPADAETPGRIDCAYRLMEALAPAIEGFPLEVDREGVPQTSDYRAALAEVKRWYGAHHADYVIRTDTY